MKNVKINDWKTMKQLNKTLREFTVKIKAVDVVCNSKKTAHAADQMSEKLHFHLRRKTEE